MRLDSRFYREEIRCEHLVSTHMKKVWAVELQLLEAFDRVCRDNNLRYFAGFGTLLGTVRHGGFIPWDDDVDVVMFREDYEKLKAIAPTVFQAPYEFQDENCPYLLRTFCKLRDSRTTAIEFPEAPEDFNQGIFIDIFPWDDGYDSASDTDAVWEMEREMWMALTTPEKVLGLLDKGGHTHAPEDIIRYICCDKTGQGIQIFSSFCAQHSGASRKVNLVCSELNSPGSGYLREWFDETVYLPFENFRMPVPVGYDQVLRHQFGDYLQIKKFASLHEGIEWDPEKPYAETLRGRLPSNVEIPDYRKEVIQAMEEAKRLSKDTNVRKYNNFAEAMENFD